MKNKNHFIVICGYPDTKIKEKTLLELLRRLKMLKKYTLCYSTHCENIPNEIYRICDYVIYSNNNPILNWDIKDNFTKTFGSEAKFFGGQAYVQFYQPYHGFAHHLSVSDGILMGLNEGYEYFTLMNYDVIKFCLRELNNHYSQIRLSGYDAIFYRYDEKGSKNSDLKFDTINLNTEFFTFNKDVALKIAEIRTYEQFSNNQVMLYEHIISKLMHVNNFKVDLRTFETPNYSLGKIAFSDLTAGQDDIIKNTKYFVPFYEKWVDKKRYCFFWFPIKMKDVYTISIIDETEGRMNCTAHINDNLLQHKNGDFYRIELPTDLKIYDGSELKVHIELNDDRQFGNFFQKVEEKDESGNVIGETTVVL